MMRQLLFVFVTFAALATHAAAGITPERLLQTPSPAVPLKYFRNAALVSDGEDFLAVWSEGNSGDIQVAAVTRDGTVSLPRTIYTASTLGIVSACWTGSVYLVTWNGNNPQNGVYAATLGRDGSLLSGPKLIVGDSAFPLSVASNGRRALMLYEPYFPVSAMRAAIFDTSGNVIAIDLPLAVSGFGYVASDGNDFGVMLRTYDAGTPKDDQTVVFLRLGESGEAIGTPVTVGHLGATGNWGIAAGGGKYAIVGVDAAERPRLARFVVDPGSGSVTTQPEIDTVPSYHANVFWNGSRFIAYWMSDNTAPSQLFTVPFGSAQETAPPRPSVSTRAQAADWPAMAANGTSILGTWSEGHDGYETPILGAFFDRNGEMLSVPFTVSRGWSRQLTPAMATSGAESLIVWVDSTAHDRGHIVGMRVAADGTPIDTVPFEIADALPYNPPAVAFTGSAYLVAWEQPSDTGEEHAMARRVGRDGSLGDPVTLTRGFGPAAASTSTTTLLVFWGVGVMGYRFNTNGDPIDASPIAIGSGFLPSVATNGTDFFVAWNTGFDNGNVDAPNPPDLLDVYGARVTAAGAVDAKPLPIATGPADQFLQAVGSDGRDYTVFYGLRDQNHAAPVLAAKRVLREGQLDGVTAQDEGKIAGPALWGTSLVRNAGGFRLAGNTWNDGAVVTLRTNFAGEGGGTVTLTPPLFFVDPASPIWSFLRYSARSISLSAADDKSFQLVYSRRITEGDYAGTSLVFFRSGDDRVASHTRAVRH